MDQLTKIKEAVLPILNEQGIEMYDICWLKEGKHQILQISIMREDGSMDVDTCADMAELISEKLDEIDVVEQEYMLEVCSPGAERVLRSLDEVKAVCGEYVYVKFRDEVNNLSEVKGYLTQVEDDMISIDYMDKAVKRHLSCAYANVKFIRLSVKI